MRTLRGLICNRTHLAGRRRFAEQFHVYGFEWGRDQLRWYVDGQLVRKVQNTHWHQLLHLILASERMPDGFGMPEDADLPSTGAPISAARVLEEQLRTC